MGYARECPKCKRVFTNGQAFGAHITQHSKEANQVIATATRRRKGKPTSASSSEEGNSSHKTGRHPTKKTPLDRKPVTHPSHPVNDRLSVCTGKLSAKEDTERPGKFRCFDRMLPLSQRQRPALIVEENSGEVNSSFYDGPQADYVQYKNKDSTCGSFTQIQSETENKEKLELEIEPDMEMKNWKHHMLDYCSYNSHVTIEHRNNMAENICSDDFRQDDIVVHSRVLGFDAEFTGLDEQHRHVVKKKQNDMQSNCQTLGLVSSNAAPDIQSQNMDLDERILLEHQSIGLCPESLGSQGTNASGCKRARNKITKQATVDFVKQTLANPTVPPEQGAHTVDQHIQKLENRDRELCNPMQRAASYPEQTVSKDKVQSTFLKKRALPYEEVNDSGLLRDAAALETTLFVGAEGKHRAGKVQTKEISTRSGPTGSGRPDLGNAKVERKSKLKQRQETAQLSAAENGFLSKPAEVQKPKVERENKLKPMQETAQLSAGVNSLLDKPAEAQKLLLTTSNCEKPSDKIVTLKDKLPSSQNCIADGDGSHNISPEDLSHLPPLMEDFGLYIGDQLYLSSCLNFEDDGLIDAADDLMGLDVPMDDLTDLKIF